jgi:hypothetical protein
MEQLPGSDLPVETPALDKPEGEAVGTWTSAPEKGENVWLWEDKNDLDSKGYFVVEPPIVPEEMSIDDFTDALVNKKIRVFNPGSPIEQTSGTDEVTESEDIMNRSERVAPDWLESDKPRGTLASLKEIANYLDRNGQYKMADAVDQALKLLVAIAADVPPPPAHVQQQKAEDVAGSLTARLAMAHAKKSAKEYSEALKIYKECLPRIVDTKLKADIEKTIAGLEKEIEETSVQLEAREYLQDPKNI